MACQEVKWLHASTKKQVANSGMTMDKSHPISNIGDIRILNRKDGHYQVKDQLAYSISAIYSALKSLTAIAKGKQCDK